MSTPLKFPGSNPSNPEVAMLDDLHKKYQAANTRFGNKCKEYYAAANDPEIELPRLIATYEAVRQAFKQKEEATSEYLRAADGVSSQDLRIKSCEKVLTTHADKMKDVSDSYESRKDMLEAELAQLSIIEEDASQLLDDTFQDQRRLAKASKSSEYEDNYIKKRDEMVALCSDDPEVVNDVNEVVSRSEKLETLENERAKLSSQWLTCAIYVDEEYYQKVESILAQDRAVLNSWRNFFVQLKPITPPTVNVSAITIPPPRQIGRDSSFNLDTSVPPPNYRLQSTTHGGRSVSYNRSGDTSVRDILSKSSIMESIAGTHKLQGTIVERMENEPDSNFVNTRETHGKKNPSNLQKVDGKDVTLIKEFLKAFECKVHRNTRYGWDEKYFELLDHLEHPARQCVALFHPTKEGYLMGLQALESRYASFKTHQGAIWARIGATSIDIHNLASIQDVKYAAMELLANSDKSCYATMGMSLVSNFEVKMTPATRKSWNEYLLAKNADTDCPSVDDFQNWCRHLEQLEAKDMLIKKQSLAKPGKPGATTRVAATVPDPEGAEIENPDSEEEEEDLGVYDGVFAYAAVSTDGQFLGCPLCDKENAPATHKLPDCPILQVLIPSERQSVVRRTRACRKCLLGKHFAADCSISVDCQKCNKNHHTLLHRYPALSNSISVLYSRVNQTQYRVVPIEVSSSPTFASFVTINCSLDDHAGESFVDESLIRQLGGKLRPQTQTIGYIDRTVNLHNYRTTIYIRAIGSEEVRRVDPSTTKTFNEGVQPPNIASLRAKFSHLRDIPFLAYADSPCQMLLGLDHMDLQVAVKSDVCGRPGEPIARLTRLGWTVVHNGVKKGKPNIFSSITTPEEAMAAIWEYEALPLTPNKRIISKDDLTAETIVRDGMFTENGHLGTRVPFKSYPDQPALPKNYYQVLRWQSAHERELMLNEEKWRQYVANFAEWIEEGYIIKCEADIANSFFIPCFAVIRDDSTTMKLRVVTDCARKFGAARSSLNDFIHTGPKLQNDVRDVLLQFRRYEFAFSSDIARMYLQFLLHPDDQRFHKIIFRGQTYQFTRWPFGNVAAPFATLFCLNNHFKQSGKNHLVEVARQSLYMDDVLPSHYDESQLVSLYNDLRTTCLQAGLQLRKVVSNSPYLMSSLDDDLLGITMPMPPDARIKVLGCVWLPGDDLLTFKKLSVVDVNLPLTKRHLFRINGLCFDPVGFAEPVTLKGRLLLQDVCFSYIKLAWDDIIEEDTFVSRWKAYLVELSRIDMLSYPRSLSLRPQSDVSLEVFVDASTRMYSAVVYARQVINESVMVRFVHCKRRLCKKGEKTIPQKELLAAHLGSIIARHLSTCLQITQVNFWSDSTTVLKWLYNPLAIDETFVSRRVLEILLVSSQSDWKYIASNENPADLATRGEALEAIAQSQLWLNGPARLMERIPQSSRPDVGMEKFEEATVVDGVNAVFMTTPALLDNYQFISDFNAHPDQISAAKSLLALKDRFSVDNLGRLEKSFSVWFKLLRRRNGLALARRTTLRVLQAHAFSNELEFLVKHKKWRIDSEVEKTCAYIDKDCMLRARGRLDSNKDLSWAQKRPYVLQKSPATVQFFQLWHTELGHTVSVNQFAHIIRRRFFVPKLRQILRGVMARCSGCKMVRQRQLTPLMGDVPILGDSLQAFAHVAIDFCGPFKIKRPRGQITDKKYVMVIACRQTKAIHLEDVSDLSTDAFLVSFIRFAARRGTPKTVRSDQGSNFVGAVGLIFKEDHLKLRKVDWEKIRRLSNPQGTFAWTFSPASTPTFNGLAEAFVKLFKAHFVASISGSAWTEDSFRAAIALSEKMINDRPLEYVPESFDDAAGIITPNTFLMTPQVHELEPSTEDSQLPLQEYRKLKLLKQTLWDAWNRHLYNELASRPKWRKITKNLAVNDVVLIRDRGQFEQKHSWPLGVITEIHTDMHGINRTATIRVTDKNNAAITKKQKSGNKSYPCKEIVESIQNLIPVVALQE